MKIEVNIKKKYFYVLVTLIVALISTAIITARVITTWSPIHPDKAVPASGAWHGADEVGIDTSEPEDNEADMSLQDWIDDCTQKGGCGGGGGGSGGSTDCYWTDYTPQCWDIGDCTAEQQTQECAEGEYVYGVRIFNDWKTNHDKDTVQLSIKCCKFAK